MLERLPGEMLVFEVRGRSAAKMEDHCITPKKLELKVKSQVMLLKNQDGGSGGLVNGSLGIVLKFTRRPAQNGFVDNHPSFNTPGEKLPLVRFTLENGGHRDLVIGSEEWTMQMQAKEVVSARVQIPLCLAWSLSIHKPQGQTIPYVQVDLGRVFEKVQNFNPAKVMVHPKVIEFAEELERDRVNQMSKEDDEVERRTFASDEISEDEDCDA
ncbi:hypothetical protein BG000_001925 [Podila horticola]|nr:hypothetical protein BG000_001925 [Podila horticola]